MKHESNLCFISGFDIIILKDSFRQFLSKWHAILKEDAYKNLFFQHRIKCRDQLI